jgi:predicted HicB family RNase H-like nuclease
MKNLDYYLGLNYKMEILKDKYEDHYIISYPDLKGCLTCSSNLETGVKLIEDAKKEWILAALEDGYSIPEPSDLEKFSGQFKLRLPKSLHRELAEDAKKEGISMNQYCLYLLSKHEGQRSSNLTQAL